MNVTARPNLELTCACAESVQVSGATLRPLSPNKLVPALMRAMGHEAEQALLTLATKCTCTKESAA